MIVQPFALLLFRSDLFKNILLAQDKRGVPGYIKRINVACWLIKP